MELYLYDVSNIKEEILNEKILKHINQYKIENKRRICHSKYSYLKEILELKGKSIDDLSFISNKPILKDFFISTSDSNQYYGFVLAECNVGLDIEEIVDERKAKKISKYLKKEYINNISSTIDWTIFESTYKLDSNQYEIKTFRLNDTIITISSLDKKIDCYLNNNKIILELQQ